MIAMPSVSRPDGTVASVRERVAIMVGAIAKPATKRVAPISGQRVDEVEG